MIIFQPTNKQTEDEHITLQRKDDIQPRKTEGEYMHP